MLVLTAGVGAWPARPFMWCLHTESHLIPLRPAKQPRGRPLSPDPPGAPLSPGPLHLPRSQRPKAARSRRRGRGSWASSTLTPPYLSGRPRSPAQPPADDPRPRAPRSARSSPEPGPAMAQREAAAPGAVPASASGRAGRRAGMAAACRRRSKGRPAPGGDGDGGSPRAGGAQGGPLVLGVAGAVEAGRGEPGAGAPRSRLCPPGGKPRRGGPGQAGFYLKMNKIKRKSGGNAPSRRVVVWPQGLRAGLLPGERGGAGRAGVRSGDVSSPGDFRGRQGAEDVAGRPGAAVAEQHEVGRCMHRPPRPAQRRGGEAGGEPRAARPRSFPTGSPVSPPVSSDLDPPSV